MNEYLISSLTQQWKKDPASRVFFRLAEEFRKGGAFEKAIEVCQEGVSHHPDYLPALVCLGRCYQQVGRLDDAETMFRKVLDRTPDNPHALRGLGFILHDHGRSSEARRYLEMLVLAEPGDAEAVGLLDRIKAGEVGFDEDTKPVPDHESVSDPGAEDSFDTEPSADLDPEPDSPEQLSEDGPIETSSVLPEEMSLESFDALDDTDELTDEQTDEITERLDPIEMELVEAIAEGEAESEATDARLSRELGAAVEVVPLSSADEARLTTGLKHEKMAHYEAAQHIYAALLQKYPGDRIVSGHHERIAVLMAREERVPKKIRLLSNWLDKIKGVYHVR